MKRAELISISMGRSWRVQRLFLERIRTIAGRPFEDQIAAAGGPSPRPAALSRHLWDQITKSLALDGTVP